MREQLETTGRSLLKIGGTVIAMHSLENGFSWQYDAIGAVIVGLGLIASYWAHNWS
jgi:hypothetical protein